MAPSGPELVPYIQRLIGTLAPTHKVQLTPGRPQKVGRVGGSCIKPTSLSPPGPRSVKAGHVAVLVSGLILQSTAQT